MRRAATVLLGSLAVAGGAATPAALGSPASAGPKVTVTIQNGGATLFRGAVRGEKGSVTKGGAPRGACPGSSAAGALDAATHGRWTAKYYKSLKDDFISSIDGVKPTGSHYWGVFVNGKSSSKGICEVRLKAGQKLLFKVL